MDDSDKIELLAAQVKLLRPLLKEALGLIVEHHSITSAPLGYAGQCEICKKGDFENDIFERGDTALRLTRETK